MKDKHDKVTPDFPEMEGDWVYHVNQIVQEFPTVAYEEAELHFTIARFEELMHKHGLWALVDQMTQKGQDAFYAVIGDDR